MYNIKIKQIRVFRFFELFLWVASWHGVLPLRWYERREVGQQLQDTGLLLLVPRSRPYQLRYECHTLKLHYSMQTSSIQGQCLYETVSININLLTNKIHAEKYTVSFRSLSWYSRRTISSSSVLVPGCRCKIQTSSGVNKCCQSQAPKHIPRLSTTVEEAKLKKTTVEEAKLLKPTT